MKIRALICSFVLVSQFSFSKALSDFEEMLSGFPECNFHGVYFDVETLTPQHKYFKDRKMKPETIEYYLAKFNVDENYHGLPVDNIYIPAGYAMVLIVIDLPINVVENNLKNVLVNGYNINVSAGSEVSIVYPSLEKDKSNPEKTILFCDAEPNYISEN